VLLGRFRRRRFFGRRVQRVGYPEMPVLPMAQGQAGLFSYPPNFLASCFSLWRPRLALCSTWNPLTDIFIDDESHDIGFWPFLGIWHVYGNSCYGVEHQTSACPSSCPAGLTRREPNERCRTPDTSRSGVITLTDSSFRSMLRRIPRPRHRFRSSFSPTNR
jgi:hypothetical protein